MIRRLPFVIVLVLDLFLVFEHELEKEKTGLVLGREIFAMWACMSAAVIEYALCGCRCARK